jgi:hypothetical protein
MTQLLATKLAIEKDTPRHSQTTDDVSVSLMLATR